MGFFRYNDADDDVADLRREAAASRLASNRLRCRCGPTSEEPCSGCELQREIEEKAAEEKADREEALRRAAPKAIKETVKRATEVAAGTWQKIQELCTRLEDELDAKVLPDDVATVAIEVGIKALIDVAIEDALEILVEYGMALPEGE